jgi:hypothetical protein
MPGRRRFGRARHMGGIALASKVTGCRRTVRLAEDHRSTSAHFYPLTVEVEPTMWGQNFIERAHSYVTFRENLGSQVCDRPRSRPGSHGDRLPH